MARRDPTRNGTTETAEEARGAENSKDSFNVLKTSLLLAVIVGIGLAWYWGMLPWMHHAPIQ